MYLKVFHGKSMVKSSGNDLEEVGDRIPIKIAKEGREDEGCKPSNRGMLSEDKKKQR